MNVLQERTLDILSGVRTASGCVHCRSLSERGVPSTLAQRLRHCSAQVLSLVDLDCRLPPLALDHALSFALDHICEGRLHADVAGEDESAAVAAGLQALAQVGCLDIRHEFSIQALRAGLLSSASAAEDSKGGEEDEDAAIDHEALSGKVAGATQTMVEALTAHDALRRAVSSPADTLTHFAVGYAVAKSGHLRVAIVLLSRQAAVAAASVAATVHAHESATSVAVYTDELERSGAEALVVTVEAAPELQLLGARIAVLDGSAATASQQQLASSVATPLAGIASAAEEQSLEQMAGSWRQLQRPAFEADASAWSSAPDATAAAAGAAGAKRAVVLPWQLQRTSGDGGSARRVGVPIPAALLRAAAAAAGGTVLVQIVGAAASSDAAATAPFNAPDAAFTAANLAVLPPAVPSTGTAGSGPAALQSAACFPIRVFESRAADSTASTLLALGVGAVSHSESGSAAASRRASLLPSSASAGAPAASARASGSTPGGVPAALPGGLRVPSGAPSIATAARSGAFSSLSVISSAAAAASLPAGARLQHLRADTAGSAPLTLLLPLSVALEAAGGSSSVGSARAVADGAVSRLMLVSGASEEDALASAPDGFDLLPLNLAELVRQQLASGSTGASAGGSSASSRSASGVACTVHPAAVYIAVQRGGGVAPAQPLLDAGLLVALGVSAASGAAAAAASDAGSRSSEAQLLLPSMDAPAGYTLQIKDVSVAAEAPDVDASGGEGKRGDDTEEGEDGDARGGRPTVGVRIALLSSSDADAVAAAIGSGSGPVSVRLTDHPAAADASSRLASGRGAGAEAAAGAGAGAGSSRGADSSSRGQQQQRLQMDADGVVGSGGEPADGSRAGPGGRDGDAAASSAAGSGGAASVRVSALLAAGTGRSRAPSGAESPEDGSEEGGPRGPGAPPAAPPLSAGSARKAPPAPPARKPAAPPAALITGAGGGAGGRGLAGGEPGGDRHRQQLLELLQAAMAEQERLGSANSVLQRQLAIYFSLRHSDDDAKDGGASGAGGGAGSKNAAAAAFAAADKDRRYREQLDSVATDRERLSTLLSQSEAEATELQSRVEEKEGRCGQLLRAFGDFKHQIAAAAVNSHTGRHIPPEELARYEGMERDRDAEVSKVQLRHLHLSSQVAKLTDQLKRRDRVADGLAMMDFEQLKIENSTLSERIEDRSEELAKLKKKATVAVQILTHVREKLHFVQAEAARLAGELQVVEDEVTDQRAVLASAKHERDRFRGEMEKASHAQGFAHNDRLAIDFERRKRDIVALRDRLEATRDRWQRLADVAADRSALLETVMAGGGGAYGGGGGGGGFGASVGAGGFGGASAGPAAYGATGGTAAGGFGRSTMGGTGGAMGATGKTGAGSASLGYGRPPVGGASASGRR